MEIIVGKTSGFCNGVKFTIDKANEMINKYKKLYCLGQIVHNERVIKDLENKGMITINNIDDCPNNSRLIIRAHGEVKDVYDEAQKRNIELIDLTWKIGKKHTYLLTYGLPENFSCETKMVGKKDIITQNTDGTQSTTYYRVYHPRFVDVISIANPMTIQIGGATEWTWYRSAWKYFVPTSIKSRSVSVSVPKILSVFPFGTVALNFTNPFSLRISIRSLSRLISISPLSPVVYSVVSSEGLNLSSHGSDGSVSSTTHTRIPFI